MKYHVFCSKGFILGLVVSTLLLSFSVFAQEFKVGMVLDLGGRDDKSFNSSAVQGINQAKEKLKIVSKFVEPNDENAFEPMLRSFAQKNFDLIIAIGVSQVEAVKRVAGRYPQQSFLIVDGEVKAPNVRSILFREHEGSYLVGAIAAMNSKSGKIGFIGGMDIPIVRRFELGYSAGAQKINPNVKVVSNFIGVTAEAWNNPARAKELAVTQYSSGADVIFSASGASVTGLFDAAEEKKKYAIGVDANQNWIKPGFILTSMVKKIDQAIFTSIQEAVKGEFNPGTQYLGLANQGVDYTLDQYNEKVLTLEMRKKTDGLKKDIIDGKLSVPDYYEQRKKK
jgi:basic membrane protein A